MKRELAALSGGSSAICHQPACPLLPFFLYLHVVFDEWKCGLLFEAGGIANKQIGWELKFSFPGAMLNCQRMHRASGGDWG